jgi:hypothetical protein
LALITHMGVSTSVCRKAAKKLREKLFFFKRWWEIFHSHFRSLFHCKWCMTKWNFLVQYHDFFTRCHSSAREFTFCRRTWFNFRGRMTKAWRKRVVTCWNVCIFGKAHYVILKRRFEVKLWGLKRSFCGFWVCLL